MKIFKKRKIVPVRTHDKGAPLLKNTYKHTPEHGNPWVLSSAIENPLDRGYKFYHLHILSDEMGEEGDWVMDLDYDPPLIFRADNEYTEVGFQAPKIIATTDKSLTLYDSETLASAPGFKLSTEPICLPWIQLGLVMDFCQMGGFKEVEVEYKDIWKSTTYDQPAIYKGEELKVLENNTITVRTLKDSWNREEVESLLDKLFWWKHYNPNMEDKDFLKWIKETL